MEPEVMQTPGSGQRHWYTVHTKPRKEAAAQTQLANQGFETWLPTITLERRIRGRWKKVTEPLFPRYLFLRADLASDNTASVRSTLGVSGFVRFGQQPPPIADGVVETLQAQARQQDDSGNTPLFKSGDTVRLMDGPFKDLTGIYQTESGETRALVLLQLLGRQNQVAIERDALVSAS